MKNRISFILVCGTALLLAGLAASTKSQTDTSTREVMKSKSLLQGVLEGIATENYNLMARMRKTLAV
jgi:hypothetical protein